LFSLDSELILRVLHWLLYYTLLAVSTPRNCRHVHGRMSLYGYICLIFFVVQTLLITVQMPTTYSRDQLLSLRVSATLLNHDQCLKITQLGLRRRGCRAGNHTRRSRQAAHSVTSSTCCTSTCGEIPVINGHRILFTNNDQLFSRRRGEPTVCQSCSKTTSLRRRRRQLSSRRLAPRAVPLCRHAVLQDALSASCSSATLSCGVDEPAPSGYQPATAHHGRRIKNASES